jgi:hypothetical protein
LNSGAFSSFSDSTSTWLLDSRFTSVPAAYRGMRIPAKGARLMI